MNQAKQGDTVRIHYTGKLEDGTVLESSRDRKPFELVLGTGQVISGLEQAVQGMEPGESKSVHIPVQEAFGVRADDMVLTLDRDKLAPELTPTIGQEVTLNSQDGRPIPAVITDVNDASVTVDANHPLAGKDLVFDVELLEIL